MLPQIYTQAVRLQRTSVSKVLDKQHEDLNFDLSIHQISMCVSDHTVWTQIFRYSLTS